MTQGGKTGLSVLDSYINLVERFRVTVIFLFVTLAALALVYTVKNLGMNTNTKEMLSPELPWRQLDREYEKHFPQYLDYILVVTAADTPDQAADAANRVYNRLLDEEDRFKTVYYPRSLPIFRENALLFLSEEELYELSDNLARIQPFLARLTDDMSLRGLFTMLDDALNAIENGEDINIEPVISELTRAIEATLAGQSVRVSWQNLMDSEEHAPGTRHYEFILVQPVLDNTAMLPASAAIDRIRELIAGPDIQETGATVRLSGGTVLSHEELLSVSRGTGTALILSVCMVTIIMVWGLKSLRLVGLALITLVTGLLLTTAFATLTIGELNLISVAFAVLYIGLGIDFAIHYCLRYRELRLQGTQNARAIEESSRNLGQSLFICTLTTAIGFFAFIPTDYQGVAELGLISGVGMFISLFVTLTLLPALLRIFPLDIPAVGTPGNSVNRPSWLVSLPERHAGKIKPVAFSVLLISLLIASQLRFDSNILNLQDPQNESVRTYADLLESSETSPWTGVIIANDRNDAIETKNRIEQLSVVDKVVWLEDFVPENQEEKLAIIDELNLIVPGGFSGAGLSTSLTADEKYEVLRRFLAGHGSEATGYRDRYLVEFIGRLQTYVNSLAGLNPEQRALSLDRLSTAFLASLPGRLDMLDTSLNADTVSRDTLSDELVDRWLSPDGYYLLSIYPVENLNDNDAMRRFVDEIYRTDPRIIGPPVVNIRAGDAVIAAFGQALGYAVAAIALLLLVLLRHKRDSLLILSTLLFAVIVTGAVSVLLGIPLNFANIIALPLLLGMGVDSGIHILHRYRTALPEHRHILATSSARAVIVSALTTMCSIGNLAFSPHAGTASMGKLLSIGIAMTLVATLLVLPGLLGKNRA